MSFCWLLLNLLHVTNTCGTSLHVTNMWDNFAFTMAVHSTRGTTWCHVHTLLHTSSRHPVCERYITHISSNYLFQSNLILILPLRVSQFTTHALSISGKCTHGYSVGSTLWNMFHLSTTSSQRHAHQSGTSHRCPLNQVLPLTFHYF